MQSCLTLAWARHAFGGPWLWAAGVHSRCDRLHEGESCVTQRRMHACIHAAQRTLHSPAKEVLARMKGLTVPLRSSLSRIITY
jgi:hypothetical protein